MSYCSTKMSEWSSPLKTLGDLMFITDVYIAAKLSNLPCNEQIREARKLKNWLQKDLGGKLGVCLSYISKVENGIEVPSIDLAKKISKVLAPYINKTAFIKKVLEKKGIKEEDIYFFKHLIAKIKRSLKKA